VGLFSELLPQASAGRIQENHRNGQDDREIAETSEPFTITRTALNSQVVSPGAEKSPFEDQSEENSVNIKINDFVGNILQNKFYACCYVLLSGTRPKHRCTVVHLSVALLCYFGATGAETSLLLTAYCTE